MSETIKTSRRLERAWVGKRLDQALAALFPQHSRARLQAWTRAGEIRVDGRIVKPNYRVQGGEVLIVDVTVPDDHEVLPQAIALSILHEDEQILVVDKPAGLVVHPAAGNRDGTLQNALLHHDRSLAAIPRGGIVHRLDKLTSGVLVVARTLAAHTELVRQLQARTVSREYRALVHGRLLEAGTVDAPIGRHPRDRTRMAVTAGGRPAVTHYRPAELFGHATLLAVKLETGRTHQIRVHLAHRGHPLLGDPVYGRRRARPRGAAPALEAALASFPRQALHARHLAFRHPATSRTVRFSAPWPEDLCALREALREHDGGGEP